MIDSNEKKRRRNKLRAKEGGICRDLHVLKRSDCEPCFGVAVTNASSRGTSTDPKSAFEIKTRKLPLSGTRRAHELFAVVEHLDQLWQLGLSALALRRKDGSVELASRLESLARREQFGNMRRRRKRPGRRRTRGFGHVKGKQRHSTFELRQQVGMLFTTRCQLLGGKSQGFIDETGSNELDETLLLQVEEQQWIVVQNLLFVVAADPEREGWRTCQNSCPTVSREQ